MSEEYAHDALRIVAAQVASAERFDSLSLNAVDAMADLLKAYLKAVGQRAHANAELCSRTKVNGRDVLAAFRELNTSIEELKDYAAQPSDLAFPYAVPKFPIPKKSEVFKDNGLSAIMEGGLPPQTSTSTTSSTSLSTSPATTGLAAVSTSGLDAGSPSQGGSSGGSGGPLSGAGGSASGSTLLAVSAAADEGGGPTTPASRRRAHVPAFLPPFPEPRTYMDTAVFSRPFENAKVIRRERSQQVREAETALGHLISALPNTTATIINYDTGRRDKVVPAGACLGVPSIVSATTIDSAAKTLEKWLSPPAPGELSTSGQGLHPTAASTVSSSGATSGSPPVTTTATVASPSSPATTITTTTTTAASLSAGGGGGGTGGSVVGAGPAARRPMPVPDRSSIKRKLTEALYGSGGFPPPGLEASSAVGAGSGGSSSGFGEGGGPNNAKRRRT